jgi:hypothetical protein
MRKGDLWTKQTPPTVAYRSEVTASMRVLHLLPRNPIGRNIFKLCIDDIIAYAAQHNPCCA